MPQFHPSAKAAPESVRVGDVDPARIVKLTIVLHPSTPLPVPGTGGHLSHSAYLARLGSDSAAIDAVRAFAATHGLSVVSAEAATHLVKLRGTYAQAIAALSPESIGMYDGPDGVPFVGRSGHLHLPQALMPHVVAVMGLDQRPIARPHFRRQKARTTLSYTPPQVAARYEFPTRVTGAGQTIALIELGGGYTATQMAAYFGKLGVKRTGSLVSVAVDDAENAPDGNPDGADGEVQLDVQVAGSVAPGADIAVYFGPNQGAGFHDAISAAVNHMAVSVISISWGGPESTYTAQDIAAFQQVLQQAATLGITVCAASGDSGSTDGVDDGKNHVDFPASSPFVLSCGGTRLPTSGMEAVWNDGSQGGAGGGGYSALFAKPAFQEGVAGVHGPMRGVPDVAGNADPQTGYAVSVDGTAAVIGGTSAVAPLWAALVALINESVGRHIGFPHAVLYAHGASFTDIVSGNNGAFSAGPGWDPATGLGSPLGPAVVQAFQPRVASA